MKTLLAATIATAAFATSSAFAETVKTAPANGVAVGAPQSHTSNGIESTPGSRDEADFEVIPDHMYPQVEQRDLSPHLEAWYIRTRSPSIDR